MPPRRQSWWQTFPGYLTGLGALVGAVASLLLAINQLKSSPDARTSSPQSFVASTPTEDSARHLTGQGARTQNAQDQTAANTASTRDSSAAGASPRALSSRGAARADSTPRVVERPVQSTPTAKQPNPTTSNAQPNEIPGTEDMARKRAADAVREQVAAQEAAEAKRAQDEKQAVSYEFDGDLAVENSIDVGHCYFTSMYASFGGCSARVDPSFAAKEMEFVRQKCHQASSSWSRGLALTHDRVLSDRLMRKLNGAGLHCGGPQNILCVADNGADINLVFDDGGYIRVSSSSYWGSICK